MTTLARLGLLVVALPVAAVGLLVGTSWEPDRPVAALAGRWAPPPSRFVPLSGLEVHLRDEGPRHDPRPVVLLHGTSASLHTWDGWASALAARRRVIRFDLPGFGLTGPAPDGDYRVEAYARLVVEVLDVLGVERCVLGGSSFGGRVAWQVALERPERVEKLVLVDAAGYPTPDARLPLGFQAARVPLLAGLMERTLPRAVVARSVRGVYGHPERVTEELIDRYFELTLRAGNRAALGERFRQAPGDASSHRIASLRLPVLILWGGRDQLIPPAAAQRFHDDIAGSRLVIFDDLGHVPHEEDPSRTLAPLLEFLDAPAP